ncbi:MAG: ADP-ribosylglycohydrolase family protein [Acidimicrobiia bacterium]
MPKPEYPDDTLEDDLYEDGEPGEVVEPAEEPLFRLVSGEGDGFMLGVAAGDTAGGASTLGYSAVAVQVTIIAYELIEHRQLDYDRLVRALLELDGAFDGERVFRGESPEFRSWLDKAGTGQPLPVPSRSLDAAPRGVPLGVALRRQPEAVIAESVRLGRLFHSDASTVAAGVVAAAAAAASCFAQIGRDFITGTAEAVVPHIETIAAGLEEPQRLERLAADFDRALAGIGVSSGPEALARLEGDEDDPLTLVLAGLMLAAQRDVRFHLPVEQAARIGGSPLGATVGGWIGARIGIRAWPWAFVNDTWFAEIGRRLVRGPDEVADLPIPYAVEHHLISGETPGFH